ncbi:MAG: hypothetical protein QNJ30_22615 [Kiloniellales bacterium]|nr:hypothetical protein [Kiloniellales bacterium]
MATLIQHRQEMPERGFTSIRDKAEELNRLYRQWDELNAFEALDVDERIGAIESEVTALPAVCLADAAVQLMIATAHLEYLRSEAEDLEPALLDEARVLLRSSLNAIAVVGGLELRALGAEHYLPDFASSKF